MPAARGVADPGRGRQPAHNKVRSVATAPTPVASRRRRTQASARPDDQWPAGDRDDGVSRAPPGDATVLLVGTLGGGGIHRYVEEQCRHLAGHLDVDVYDMYSEPKGSGVAWFVRSLALAALAALRFPFRRRPDVVHVHTSQRYSFVRAAFYALFAAHIWRRPVVLHVHGSAFDDFVETGTSPAGRLLDRLQSAVFDACDAVVVLSPYWKRTLADDVGDGKLVVLPNAVVPGEYDPSYGGRPPTLVFVSNLVGRKGVAELVGALETLLAREDLDFRAHVAGTGPRRGTVEALAAAHDAVEYHGYVSEPDKRALLSAGSVYALPAHAEGLPIAMLEGMAGGNAVVATAVGAIPEVVGPENGLLVEPGDEAALADALAALLADPARAERMGRANRAAVEERYSWAAATESLLALYARVLADGDGPPSSADV